MVSCLGSLVQSCCGEGGALQANVPGVCGEHSQCSGHTGIALAHRVCAFQSTLLRLQAALQGAGLPLCARPCPSRSGSGSWVLHKEADWVGPVFCAVSGPRSSGNQELEEHTLFRCSATSPLHVAPQFAGAPGPMPLVSLLGS